ncbi:MAG: hypothetical protein JSW27_03395 [Phycisphaerales bacterium]|nr:MAG: hypothetical protein JSW27_03395 [Phycisphaerales bacterium]
MASQQCPECDGVEFYSREVSAKGGYGPDLLPGTGWFFSAKFRLCICARCGYVKWFVPERFLDDIKTRGKFQKMS